MRIEGISPIVYGKQASPISTVTDTSSSKNDITSTAANVVPEDFNAVLKKCVSELADHASNVKENSLAGILGVSEEMIDDMLKTSEGKQKLADMAHDHLTSVVLSAGKEQNEDSSIEDFMEASQRSTDSDTMTQELQSTFESLASIYNRTIKQADQSEE